MKDHTDNKMNLSLDYSLQLSTPLDNNERSIPIVGANGLKAGIPQTPSLHHLSPPNTTMSPCQPMRIKESCVKRKKAPMKISSKPSATDTALRIRPPFQLHEKGKVIVHPAHPIDIIVAFIAAHR